MKGETDRCLFQRRASHCPLEACTRLGINPMPKFTVLVVAKRHHVRFFPRRPEEAGQGDKSGNVPAGTVVDSEITNPAEFDFYLQSHGGLLGTSRPAHYNVLLDENDFRCGGLFLEEISEKLILTVHLSPDGIQQLCFALCHVYARSTRSGTSLKAPFLPTL